MSDTPPPVETFSAAVTESARTLHKWVRIAAIATAIWGGVLFLFAMILAGVATPRAPAARGVILAVGTTYALIALAILCMAFVLVRYAQKLALAAAHRRAGPLVEATVYEEACWKITAVFVAVWLLSTAAGALAPGIGRTFRRSAASSSEARRTYGSMERISIALERYAAEHHQYPEVRGIEALAVALKPYGGEIPRRDGWDRLFDYEAICRRGACADYRLSSAGADARYTDRPLDLPSNRQPTQSAAPGADLVFGHGRPLLTPAGTP